MTGGVSGLCGGFVFVFKFLLQEKRCWSRPDIEYPRRGIHRVLGATLRRLPVLECVPEDAGVHRAVRIAMETATLNAPESAAPSIADYAFTIADGGRNA